MASLLFIDFDSLLMDFARDNDLHKWCIIVASHEIVGSIKLKSCVAGITQDVQFESKYDNIEFVSSLRPTPTIMQWAYGADKDTFVELYNNHLINAEPFMDLCCIADMVLNEDYNVMVVMAKYEHVAHINEILRDFIEDEFHIKGYLYDDLLQLREYFGKDSYRNIVSNIGFDVPEGFDGSNFDVILQNYCSDIEEAKKNLEVQKIIATNSSSSVGEEDDITSVFFNRFTEDLEDKLREVLMNKDLEMVKELCRQKKVRIAPKATKEFLVDKLMLNFKKDSVRDVEYED